MQMRLAVLLITWLVIAVRGAALQPPDPPGSFSVYLPLVYRVFPGGVPPLLVSALYYDTYLTGEPDEAFQVYNPAAVPANLTGWQLTDGSRSLVFPAGFTLEAGARVWCTRQAVSFRHAFGTLPGCEYAADSDPSVPNMTGTAWQFGNSGGRVMLVSPSGLYRDTVVYEGGALDTPGWRGEAVYPYRPTASFGEEGQILYRKLDQQSGLPVPDTDTRADWASDPQDVINGRKVQYPGWDLERFFVPTTYTVTAGVQIVVAPDHAFEALSALLQATQQSIRFEGYTFESAPLAAIVADRARAGVAVQMMLEGGPAGGVTDQQRWVVQQIAEAGGDVYYLRGNSAAGIHARYLYQHGKFWVLDGRVALIGSENPGAKSFPDDDKQDGTFGQRGLYVVTDAAPVVAAVEAIMDADMAPARHGDVWAWDPLDPQLGAPPPGFVPTYESGGAFYPVQKPLPLSAQGTFVFQVFHSPEQSLRDRDGLLGLVNRAGPGDTVLVEQLYEQTYWGPESSNVTADPNPRLEAYIAAARRGAAVRVLLDAYLDNQSLGSPRSNQRTVEYLRAVAQAEGLDLQARRANPTGQGIHNKMILAQIGGRGWVIAGSLNGGEVSAKLNREMGLILACEPAYEYLAELFWYDWRAGRE